jgi:protein-tyrosine phosphatase
MYAGRHTMIDWHCHVLPNMDDGSKNADESLAMLEALHGQGVSQVVATPHFYASDESVDDFLGRREKSFQELLAKHPDLSRDMLLGAEVSYYPGIHKMKGLQSLSIGESKLLLLEMPMEHWSRYTVDELIAMASTSDVVAVLAHVERYLTYGNEKYLGVLREHGVLMQVNASFFRGLRNRHIALKMLQSESIDFIGSDSHNMKSRPPMLGEAYETIKKRLGEEFVSQFIRYGYNMLRHT